MIERERGRRAIQAKGNRLRHCDHLAHAGYLQRSRTVHRHNVRPQDLGGDAPESVALSILAEMMAALNQRNGRMLKHRSKPIHQVDLVVREKSEVPAAVN
ncbi:hypothetical protein [Pseudomonas sp. C1C7]|uniref:hypothetical protein n=1 Tax=Pseudomonas sp. C1C7 TaxID=2735272 RepID=UPI003557A2DF